MGHLISEAMGLLKEIRDLLREIRDAQQREKV